jgi:hypothetical protein
MEVWVEKPGLPDLWFHTLQETHAQPLIPNTGSNPPKCSWSVQDAQDGTQAHGALLSFKDVKGRNVPNLSSVPILGTGKGVRAGLHAEY